jgi:Cu+-exporting ATPase
MKLLKKNNRVKTFTDKVSHHFSIYLLLLSFGTLLFWLPQNRETGLNAFTAILIVACPCTLALSTPFTVAATLSIFDRNRFYLKKYCSCRTEIDTIVFDKTGTVTLAQDSDISFKGNLTSAEKSIIYAACKNSIYPLSRQICNYLGVQNSIAITDYFEIPDSGIMLKYLNKLIGIGSHFFVLSKLKKESNNTEVHTQIGSRYLGFFSIK